MRKDSRAELGALLTSTLVDNELRRDNDTAVVAPLPPYEEQDNQQRCDGDDAA